jgi:molybdopterin-guanine dinucleotide biosynthesis protein A
MGDSSGIPGLILAGGRAQRMGGGDKPMRILGGRPLLDHIIARLAPQCDGLILNSHGDPARFSIYGLPVIADAVEGFAGPLAGILAGLDHVARERPAAREMLSVAGDCPFLPNDLVARLSHARAHQGADLAIAASGGQLHPTVALWSVDLRHDLRHALIDEHCHAVQRFAARHREAVVGWPDTPLDPFFNINTAEDLAEAERLSRAHQTPA